MRKIALAVVIAAMLGAPASAQPPRLITLDDAIARVQRVGFDLRLARADEDIASADARSAQALLAPQIGVSLNALDANEPQLGMPIARQAYGAATLSIPLYTPANGANARAARASASAATTETESRANDDVFGAIAAYRRVQLADAVLESRRASVADQERHLRVTEQRVAVGKTARYVTLRDRSLLAAATQAQEDAASDRDRAANDLAVLLDLGQEGLAVEPLAAVGFSDSRDASIASALKHRPSVVAAEARVVEATIGATVARDAYRPSAVLTAQTYNGTSSPSLGRSGGQVQVTASLPILDGGSRSAASLRARAQIDRAVALRDQVRSSVVRDVANAYREYEAATRNLATARAAETDAREGVRLAELREHAGKAIDVEVLDALALAAVARESIARSLARYDLAVAAIHHAVGERAAQPGKDLIHP